MSALSSVGIALIPFTCKAGTVEPVISETTGAFISSWDVAGVKQISDSPSFNAANDDVGFLEVPIWGDAKVDFYDLITLDVADLYGFYYVRSAGDLYGTFAASQVGITSLYVAGQNAISDVSGLVNLTFLYVIGQNTISDVSQLVNLTFLYVAGQNTISFDTVPTFPSSMRYLNLNNSELSGDSVANLIEGLSLVETWTHEMSVYIAGDNAAPPSSSDVHIAAIQAAGATVVTN